MHSKISKYFGQYGGCFAPETLMAPLQELEHAYLRIAGSEDFLNELNGYLRNFVGRPTALTYARNLTRLLQGPDVYLKREDLAHTGAHKINNALGQGLLAKAMGKSRLIAETGAGQHGVATATIASLLGLRCSVFMGAADMERQSLNVTRMQVLGAEVHAVYDGRRTLKDATSAAMREWVASVHDAYYVLGSALGPHPYPSIVRNFQRVIGDEARAQILSITHQLPQELIACVGGGSNAIGLFSAFINDKSVRMTGVEAGGIEIVPGQHAARFSGGRVGVFHGTKSYFLQNEYGQIDNTRSISAGLDYPGVGPEHAFLYESGRVHYTYASDEEALAAAYRLAKCEGIIPALESAHALAYLVKNASRMKKDAPVIVNLSGRGDKDIGTLGEHLSRRKL